MKRAPRPNYTQSPNVFYDEWLRDIDSMAELKVVEIVIRHTFGWHEDEVELSLSKLMELTGLARSSVIDGVQRGIADGYIARRKDGLRGVGSLRITVEPDDGDDVAGTGSDSLPVNTEPTGSDFLPLTGSDSGPDPVANRDQSGVSPNKRKKVKEKEQVRSVANSPQRGTRLSADFTINQSMQAWAVVNAPNVELATALAEFKDYWKAIPGRAGVKLDWEATWRNRMRLLQGREKRNGRPAQARVSGSMDAVRREVAQLEAERDRL